MFPAWCRMPTGDPFGPVALPASRCGHRSCGPSRDTAPYPLRPHQTNKVVYLPFFFSMRKRYAVVDPRTLSGATVVPGQCPRPSLSPVKQNNPGFRVVYVKYPRKSRFMGPARMGFILHRAAAIRCDRRYLPPARWSPRATSSPRMASGISEQARMSARISAHVAPPRAECTTCAPPMPGAFAGTSVFTGFPWIVRSPVSPIFLFCVSSHSAANGGKHWDSETSGQRPFCPFPPVARVCCTTFAPPEKLPATFIDVAFAKSPSVVIQ